MFCGVETKRKKYFIYSKGICRLKIYTKQYFSNNFNYREKFSINRFLNIYSTMSTDFIQKEKCIFYEVGKGRALIKTQTDLEVSSLGPAFDTVKDVEL